MRQLKKSQLNKVPFHTLFSFVVDNRGKTCPTSQEGLPLIATNCINGESLYPEFNKVRFVDKETYDTWFRSHPLPGDILFVLKGSPGRSCLVPDPVTFCIAQDMVALRVNRDLIYPPYLFAVLRNKIILRQIEQLHVGSLIPHFKKSSFKELKIPLVNDKMQRYIGDLHLDLLEKIELLQKQNETLEALAQTLFRQWFIEEADDSWEEVDLIDVFEFKEGPGIRNWQYVEDGFPFINIRLIKKKEIDKSTANCVSYEEANGKYSHFKLEEDDFVMSTSGTLGKNAIVRDYHLPLLLNTSVIRFRPKKSYLKCFMYQYLQSREFTEYLLSAASGSVQLNFGPFHLKAIRLRLPSKKHLESFEMNCNSFYEKINHNYKSIQTLVQTRDTLLPKLMSGQVRVKLD